ncbi:MAG: NADH-quinone oxidoreductase subunit NuoF [Defluviitaleaceae bacterium]|nr:NADH-quinone oxidoreductase subunit NuoF [Defluviitaleaceae bacterium]
MSNNRTHFLVCGGAKCEAGAAVIEALNKVAKEKGVSQIAHAVSAGCFGFCENGTVVRVHPDNTLYIKVKPEDAEEIIDSHAIGGKPVKRLQFDGGNSFPFKDNQVRIALRNCGVIDPERIEEYILSDGYEALAKSLFSMSPDDVIETVSKSGLRGRGGAGASTGFKWSVAKKSEGETKYVMCNADEGDPGAFMDRSILEGDPHSVLEAMAICGYAIGASDGIIYIRAEYPLAVKRLRGAIAQAEKLGLLGDNIMGSGFSFHIRLYLGAGAFVCGEETSLMNSVQGGRGEPRLKPPFPAQIGLWGKPTNINNVETFANIASIIRKGPEWYRQFGTEKSPGTKVFALAGKVRNVGLIEIPMGMPLRSVVDKVGGGIQGGKKFKAVQTGGPSGGLIPERELESPVDFEALQTLGSIMGSGAFIVMDEDDCMVNIAKFFLEFTADESCGKCTPCRIGNQRLLEILTKICNGEGKEEHMNELENLGRIICDTSLCGLGKSSPNPVLSTLKFFRREYEEHIRDNRCEAGACTNLLRYSIIEENCIGCTVCKKNCPVDCISGELKQVHTIDQSACIKCGVCMQKCKFKAIARG